MFPFFTYTLAFTSKIFFIEYVLTLASVLYLPHPSKATLQCCDLHKCCCYLPGHTQILPVPQASSTETLIPWGIIIFGHFCSLSNITCLCLFIFIHLFLPLVSFFPLSVSYIPPLLPNKQHLAFPPVLETEFLLRVIVKDIFKVLFLKCMIWYIFSFKLIMHLPKGPSVVCL